MEVYFTMSVLIVEKIVAPMINSLPGKTKLKRAAMLLYHKLLLYLIPLSWVVVRKNLSAASERMCAAFLFSIDNNISVFYSDKHF